MAKVAVSSIGWNDFKNLKPTLTSFHEINPTFSKDDMFIVDNGSTDGSKEFIRESGYKNFFDLPENIGIYDAEFMAWKSACEKGYEFILNVQSDFPSISPVPFEALAKYLTENPDVGFIRLNDKMDGRWNIASKKLVKWQPWQTLEGKYQIAKYNYHMSFHPYFFRASLVAMLEDSWKSAKWGKDERSMMEGFSKLDYIGSRIRPPCFHTYLGSRNQMPGWKH